MSRYSILALVVAATTSIALAACGDRQPPDDDAERRIVDFDTATVRLATASDTVPLHLELAVTESQHQVGLMERRQLDERAGMLFIYPITQPPDAGFWMYRTRIPLDIAFLDSTGVIRSIRAMVPCPTTIPQGCPTYPPGTNYRYALEMNAGAFQRLAADTGSRLFVEELNR